jgi:integrase
LCFGVVNIKRVNEEGESLSTQTLSDALSVQMVPRKEIKPLTPDQVYQLLKAAEGHPQEVLFILALSTGMRRGELLGLKWQDIDFERGIVQVRRALVRMPTGHGFKEASRGPTTAERGGWFLLAGQ